MLARCVHSHKCVHISGHGLSKDMMVFIVLRWQLGSSYWCDGKLQSRELDPPLFVSYELASEGRCFPDVSDVINALLLLVEPPDRETDHNRPGRSAGASRSLTRCCFFWFQSTGASEGFN